jgi:hypothetical protein
MTKIKLQSDTSVDSHQNVESIVLETRKVKALEKIANSLDALTIWFEEINKNEWSERAQYYLYEFYNMAKSAENTPSIDTTPSKSNTDELPPPRKVRPKKDIENV